MPASSIRTRSGTAAASMRLARRRVADAVGREREQRVGVGGRGDAERVDARQRAGVDAVLLRAVHPHADQLEVGAPGDRRGSPACPTPPVDHPTTRYVMVPPQSVLRGLGRKAQAHVGDRRPLDLVGARRSASGGAARPSRRRTTRAAVRRTSRARSSTAGAERAPRRRARCAAAARLRTPCSSRPRRAVARRRPAARAPARPGGPRANHRVTRSRERVAEHRGRAVPAQWSSSASRLRVAQPSHAAPRPLAEQRAGELAPALVDLHRAPRRRPTARAVEPDGRQRPAVGGGVTRRPRCRVSHVERGTSRGRGGRSTPDRCGRSCSTSRPCARRSRAPSRRRARTRRPTRRALRRDVRQVAAGTRLGVRDAHVHRARARGGHELGRAARRTRTRRRVGATSTAAVSISGASWYAASKLTTACQLGGRPPPPSSAGRLTPSRPAAPASPQQRRARTPRPIR